MTNKMESCFQITENGFTAVFQAYSSEVNGTFDGGPVDQQGIADEVVGSKWSYNPAEETHRELPYPYCS
jgi:hypothetical protein